MHMKWWRASHVVTKLFTFRNCRHLRLYRRFICLSVWWTIGLPIENKWMFNHISFFGKLALYNGSIVRILYSISRLFFVSFIFIPINIHLHSFFLWPVATQRFRFPIKFKHVGRHGAIWQYIYTFNSFRLRNMFDNRFFLSNTYLTNYGCSKRNEWSVFFSSVIYSFFSFGCSITIDDWFESWKFDYNWRFICKHAS